MEEVTRFGSTKIELRLCRTPYDEIKAYFKEKLFISNGFCKTQDFIRC